MLLFPSMGLRQVIDSTHKGDIWLSQKQDYSVFNTLK